jgi:hypothetical protein
VGEEVAGEVPVEVAGDPPPSSSSTRPDMSFIMAAKGDRGGEAWGSAREGDPKARGPAWLREGGGPNMERRGEGGSLTTGSLSGMTWRVGLVKISLPSFLVIPRLSPRELRGSCRLC